MSVCCVIPARMNSSRFPGKLLQKANGKTVLQYTFEKAKMCPSIDALFVATDHETIAAHVRELGGEVIFTSPTCANGTERIYEAIQKHPVLQKSDLIINLQGDHPCTEPSTLSALIQLLREDPKASMATAVTLLVDQERFLSPHVVKCVFDKHQNALYFSRAPIPYTKEGDDVKAYAHIGIYGYKTPFFKEIFENPPSFLQEKEDLEQLRVLENGHRIKIAVVEETILGIDTPKDLEKLKEIVCHLNISS